MAILKVTTTEVTNKAREIESQKGKLQNIMQTMQQLVNRLPQDEWQSDSGSDYSQKYQNVSRNCNDALNTLSSHIRNLLQAAEIYERDEQQQRSRVGQLGTPKTFS